VSLLQTYNMGWGGATVDSDLLAPYEPSVHSLKQQISTDFVNGYTGVSPGAPSAPDWTAANSIFAIWIGINDVQQTYNRTDDARAAMNTKIFNVYTAQVNRLYDAGARNFVFINVPPVDRAPVTKARGQTAVTEDKAAIAVWNGLVRGLALKLKQAHSFQVNAWIYDSNSVFSQVLDNPKSYEQTSIILNTTNYCAAYAGGTPAMDTFIKGCGVGVHKYFWLNQLHPTYHIHDVVAQGISNMLKGPPSIC